MKTLLSISLLCLLLHGSAQNDNSWHFGLQWGFHGNHSVYSGGMEGADARFNHNPFGGGALALLARYDINKHWMYQTGMGFNSFGYEYSLSNNYSLKREDLRYSTVRTEFSCLEIPSMIHYKFNPDCNNSKMVVGVGFVPTFIGAQKGEDSYTASNEGSMNADHLQSSAQTTDNMTCMLRMSIAREKLLKRGGIFSFAVVFNIGFKEIAKSHVEYEVNQQKYAHDFTNKGSYIGFKFDYYFRSFWKN